MSKTRLPLAPLFWLALIILVIQSVVFYAGEAARSSNPPAWGKPLLIGIAAVVLSVCILLIWKWNGLIAALLLAAGTGTAYLGLIGWVFGVVLVITGIVVSLAQASPAGGVQMRRMNWSTEPDGAPIGPMAVLVTMAVMVIGLEVMAGLLSADGIDFDRTPGLIDDPFRSRLILICAVMLLVLAATYAIAYRAWLSGLCLVIAAVGAILGFFILVPTSSFALLAITLSFVQPKTTVVAETAELVIAE